jgi:hypothetical protein
MEQKNLLDGNWTFWLIGHCLAAIRIDQLSKAKLSGQARQDKGGCARFTYCGFLQTLS